MATGRMGGFEADRIRIHPDLKVRLYGYIRRNPHVSKTEVLNNGLRLELARLEALEPKPESVAA